MEDALFNYNPRTGIDGIGSISYSLSPTFSTPEPSVTMTLLLLGVSGIIGYGNKQK